MSLAEIENVTKAWPPISRAVRVPRTEADYHELVELLDRITDEVAKMKIIRSRPSWTFWEFLFRNTKTSMSRS